MRVSKLVLLSGVACLWVAGVANPALAQTQAAPGATALHPWQAPMPGFDASAYFRNLRDGDKIETPFVAEFGLSGGYGLAPIAKPGRAKSGHHHLLVNRPLPMNFDNALPFNEQYIHFGKGQMESVLTFPPGTYTLRLLLADQRHIPRYVYSKPLTITVTKKNDTDPKSLVKKGIAVSVQSPSPSSAFRVQFHASGMQVADLAQKLADTGHFKLTVIPADSGKPAELDFTEGQTEVWLEPPPGDYTLKLEFRDNLNPATVLAGPVTTRVKMARR